MKKILISLGLVGLLATGSFAGEKSGGFLGVDLGISMINMQAEADGDKIKTNTAIGFTYGLKGGYKHFFTDSFGIRGYANISNASASPKFTSGNISISVETTALNYGVGVDALYNFIDNFGGFVGLGIGATNYSTKGNSAINATNATGFNAQLNLGLRTIIADMHGIELSVGVPFIKTTTNDGIEKDTYNTQAKVLVSYIFNF